MMQNVEEWNIVAIFSSIPAPIPLVAPEKTSTRPAYSALGAGLGYG
jgi:hypothetical protein